MHRWLMVVLISVALAVVANVPAGAPARVAIPATPNSVEYTGAEAAEMARNWGLTIPTGATLVKLVLDESPATCGAPVVAAASGPGPGRFALRQTVSIPVDDASTSYELAAHYEVAVPDGRLWEIQAHAQYQGVDSRTQQPVGICYAVIQY